MSTEATGSIRSPRPAIVVQNWLDCCADTKNPIPMVARKAPNAHAAAVNRRVARKYIPATAAPSLIPAANPTPTPPSTRRPVVTAVTSTAANGRLRCPSTRLVRTGSNHSTSAVATRARRRHVSHADAPITPPGARDIAKTRMARDTIHHRQTRDTPCQTSRSTPHGTTASGNRSTAANGGAVNGVVNAAMSGFHEVNS